MLNPVKTCKIRSKIIFYYPVRGDFLPGNKVKLTLLPEGSYYQCLGLCSLPAYSNKCRRTPRKTNIWWAYLQDFQCLSWKQHQKSVGHWQVSNVVGKPSVRTRKLRWSLVPKFPDFLELGWIANNDHSVLVNLVTHIFVRMSVHSYLSVHAT